MSKLKSKTRCDSLHAAKRRSDDKKAKRSIHKATRNTVEQTQSGVRFADILETTKRLYATTRAKRSKNFDNSAGYKYSTETPLALQTLTEPEHIQLVFIEKAYTRAAIVIEKSLWDTEQQLMVWTEFSDDSPEDGLTIDYVSFRQTGPRSKWYVVPSEEPVSHLSAQASKAFISYLNKITE